MGCVAKSIEVRSQLCDWHYPDCTRCKHHYNRWMKEEPEVQRLEVAAAIAESE